jgi:hypothetical protein
MTSSQFETPMDNAIQWKTITVQLDGVPPPNLDFIRISGVGWSSVVL